MPRAASRRAPGIDGVPSLSEAALRRLEREDDEHEHALPQSLPSDGSGVACDPQGLAGALACLTFPAPLHTPPIAYALSQMMAIFLILLLGTVSLAPSTSF